MRANASVFFLVLALACNANPLKAQDYTPVAELVEPTGSRLITRAVEEKDGYAYLLTREGVLHTYDISDLVERAGFTTYSAPIKSLSIGQGMGLLRDGGYLYAYGYGITVLEIGDPSSPRFIHATPGPILYNLVKHGSYLIAGGGGIVAVFSVADPSRPQLLSTYDIGGDYTFSVAAFEHVLYAASGSDAGAGLYVLDFSNPLQLSTLRVIDRTALAYHLRIVGRYLVESTTGALFLWNLNQPTDPQVVDSNSPASGRVCAVHQGNIIANGTVLTPVDNRLQPVASFNPLYSQTDGFPYGSAANARFVFLAQSPRVLILGNANQAPVPVIQVWPLADITQAPHEFLVISPNNLNAAVTLDGSLSWDPENDPLEYSWIAEADVPLLAAFGERVTVELNLGKYTITLLVHDGRNTATTSIHLEVITACRAAQELIRQVDDSTLGRNRKTPLLASLKAACASFDRGSVGSGIHQLRAFQKKVRAQTSPLDPDLAGRLSDGAQGIIDALTAP